MEISTERKHSIVYYSYILLFIVLFFWGLYHASSFLIPVSFAALFAMLLWPVAKYCERKGLSRAWSSGICVFILLLFLVGFVLFFASQLSSFSSTMGNLQGKLSDVLNQVKEFFQSTFGLNTSDWFSEFSTGGSRGEAGNTATGAADSGQARNLQQGEGDGGGGFAISSYFSEIFSQLKTFATLTFKAIVGLIVILVYTFLMLLYRHIFIKFVKKLSSRDQESERVSRQVAKVSQQYLAGRLIVIGIIAVINSVGLSLIGIKQAIFFGVLAALLDLIPYIGVIIGAGLPLIMSLINHEKLWPFFAVLGLFVFVQLLENYFLTPKIVGSKVRLNPLFTLMAVLAGGYLWGVAGMILFIPFLAMLKIIFDHIEALHPYGFLVGDPDNRTDKK